MYKKAGETQKDFKDGVQQKGKESDKMEGEEKENENRPREITKCESTAK
jgi:hypothetical protein